MLPQLKIEKRFDYDTVTYGLKLMLIGLMKKVLIADRLAPHLDNIFASVQDASGAQLLLAGLTVSDRTLCRFLRLHGYGYRWGHDVRLSSVSEL